MNHSPIFDQLQTAVLRNNPSRIANAKYGYLRWQKDLRSEQNAYRWAASQATNQTDRRYWEARASDAGKSIKSMTHLGKVVNGR